MAISYGDIMMSAGELDRLTKSLMRWKKTDADVEYAILLGKDGKCVTSSEKELKGKFLNQTELERKILDLSQLSIIKNPDRNNLFESVIPVIAAGQKVGILRIAYTTEHITAVVNNIISISLVIGLITVLIGSLLFYIIIQKGLIDPLNLACP